MKLQLESHFQIKLLFFTGHCRPDLIERGIVLNVPSTHTSTSASASASTSGRLHAPKNDSAPPKAGRHHVPSSAVMALYQSEKVQGSCASWQRQPHRCSACRAAQQVCHSSPFVSGFHDHCPSDKRLWRSYETNKFGTYHC